MARETVPSTEIRYDSSSVAEREAVQWKRTTVYAPHVNKVTDYWSPETCVQVVHTRHKKLVPECMARGQSFWCLFLVPETWAENLGRVPWALESRQRSVVRFHWNGECSVTDESCRNVFPLKAAFLVPQPRHERYVIFRYS